MDCYDGGVKTDNATAYSTYQTDYKKYCDYQREFRIFERNKSETPEKPPLSAEYEDHETFAKWKPDVKIPFDLLLYPKPIIGTNPHTKFKKLAPLPTYDKEHALKNRPRIYMTPACSMDDIPDPEMRKMLIDRMYTSEWRAAEREGSKYFKPFEPAFEKVGSADTVKLEIDFQKPIEERFRLKGKNWDDEQLRGDSDPTREFWLHKDPPVQCGACVDPLKNVVPEETKKIISSLIATEKLRLPHDKTCPTYTGYKPRLPMGVPLSKVDLPTVHPFLSTSQAITTRYAEDLNK